MMRGSRPLGRSGEAPWFGLGLWVSGLLGLNLRIPKRLQDLQVECFGYKWLGLF